MNRLSRILLLPLAALLTAVGVQAQQVAWTGSAEHLQGNDYRILIEAAIPSGYHMYDMGPYEGGPNATTFLFTAEGAALEGSVEQLTVSVRRMSSGGMQVWSSQIIHSMSTATVAVSAVSRTRWAKRALPAKVPICMPKVVSKWVSGVVSCSTEPSSAAPSAVKRNVVALGPPS